MEDQVNVMNRIKSFSRAVVTGNEKVEISEFINQESPSRKKRPVKEVIALSNDSDSDDSVV